MKSEVDVLRMDERQRSGWLLANRATLIVVGIVWLCMIGWKIAHHNSPWFLIIMVPVFALIRLGSYCYYLRRR